MPSHALSRDELIRILSVYEGTTSADGVGGLTLIDGGLIGLDDYFTDKTIEIMSGASAGETRTITVYNPAAPGTLTVGAAFNNNILAGTNYKVTNLVAGTTLAAILAAMNVPVADVATNILIRDVVGNKADTAVLVVSAVNSITAYVKGILQRANLILSQVIAMFTLKETGGTITTTGGVQDIYRVETPTGIFRPRTLLIDFTANTAAETIVINVYYRIVAGGAPVLFDTLTFAGVIAPALRLIDLLPNRFGIQITMQRTAGGALDYPFEVFYED